jgi:hypothetical protein
LNAANLLGALLIAGLVGGMAGSWAAFGLALLALLVAAYHAGDIRR